MAPGGLMDGCRWVDGWLQQHCLHKPTPVVLLGLKVQRIYSITSVLCLLAAISPKPFRNYFCSVLPICTRYLTFSE